MKDTLDVIDWKLVELLQRNARLTYAELSKLVNLTAPAVSERMYRLEDRGIILGYRAEMEPAKLGFPILAIIRLAVDSGEGCSNLLAALQGIPEVLEAHRVTGPDSAVLKVVASSTNHLEDLINRIGKIGKPTTSIITSGYKRVPLIERAVNSGFQFEEAVWGERKTSDQEKSR